MLAHWSEAVADPNLKEMRPLQIYKGNRGLDYQDIEQRQTEDPAIENEERRPGKSEGSAGQSVVTL